MLRLRQYKPEDAATIVSWCRDEESFRKWTSDRYESFPPVRLDLPITNPCPWQQGYYYARRSLFCS